MGINREFHNFLLRLRMVYLLFCFEFYKDPHYF